MKSKNIYFVGYYSDIAAKEKYTDLFECKNKFFYEASLKIIKNSKKENILYYPEQIYKIQGHAYYLFTKPPVIVDTIFKKCYRKDLKHFQSLDIKLGKISKLKKILLLVWYTGEFVFKSSKGLSKLNPLKYLMVLKSFASYFKQEDETFLKKFKHFMFRKNFLIGYKYTKEILKNIQNTPNDVFVLWGKSYSSRILLIDFLNRNKTPYLVSEHGEISGTIACSPHGIFGEIFTEKSWATLEEKSISKDNVLATEKVLHTIQKSQISTREYDDNMYFLMKYFYDNSVKREDGKKVIYVNGAEIFSSGLYWNRWNIGNEGINPKKMLLKKVVDHFDSDKYMIVYKEHPMTIKANIHSLLSKLDFPSVNFLGSMNIHDVLDLSDIVISFPSKVVTTALLYKKDVFVLGDFTIPHSIPEIGYFTSRVFSDIKEIQDNTVPYNNNTYTEICTRLIKYSLIVCDENLHTTCDFNEEKDKLNRLVDAL
jgi:hypothetical protein